MRPVDHRDRLAAQVDDLLKDPFGHEPEIAGLIRLIGGGDEMGPIRGIGLLDAAVARSHSSVFGADAYPSLDLKSAALLHSLFNSHTLVDGNKRLGWLATVVFLDPNGHSVELEDDQASDLVMDIAKGRLGIEKMAHRLGSA